MTKEISPGFAAAGVVPIRRLVALNLGLAAVQPLSAGFLLSGFDYWPAIHALAATALQLGALVQAVTAVVLWRRRRLPPRIAAVSLGLVAAVFVEVWMGYSRRYWLHVPLAVAILVNLVRQFSSLNSLLPAVVTAAGSRSREAMSVR